MREPTQLMQMMHEATAHLPGAEKIKPNDMALIITRASTEFHKQGIDCPRMDRFIDMVTHLCANQINGTDHAIPQFVPLTSEVTELRDTPEDRFPGPGEADYD